MWGLANRANLGFPRYHTRGSIWVLSSGLASVGLDKNKDKPVLGNVKTQALIIKLNGLHFPNRSRPGRLMGQCGMSKKNDPIEVPGGNN